MFVYKNTSQNLDDVFQLIADNVSTSKVPL